MGLEVDGKAAALLHDLAERCADRAGFSSFSCTIYDTAWVAMISKTVGGETRWRFPECLQFLLEHQLHDGGWESYASDADGILNTMAALLALQRHSNAPEYSSRPLPNDIQERISKATTSLQRKLEVWKVEETVHVGFEILVPSLLHLLGQQGVNFQFPGCNILMLYNYEKVAHFDSQLLYDEKQMTVLHSLEALTDKLDFDRVRHHKVGGSMMGSPSSTAAYLMQTSTWDEDAENYLSNVIASSQITEVGGVPGAFPTTNFMLSWVCKVPAHIC